MGERDTGLLLWSLTTTVVKAAVGFVMVKEYAPSVECTTDKVFEPEDRTN